VKKGYLFSLEVVISLILGIALISFLTFIYQSQIPAQQEKLSVIAIDILNTLDKQGKLEQLVVEESWNALQAGAASLAPRNSRVIIIHDGIATEQLPDEKPKSTAQMIVPVIKNNIYEMHEIILVVY